MDKMELRRKRFAHNDEVVVPFNPSQRTILTKTTEECFEIDREGYHGEDGMHIVNPIVDKKCVSFKDLSLDEVIAIRKGQEAGEDGSAMEVESGGANESLDDIIKRAKLTASRRKVDQIVDNTPYNPDVSLDDVIKSEKFKKEHSGILARLEQDKSEKVRIEKEGVPPKRGRAETLDEKWERLNIAPKVAYDENTLDMMSAKGVSMDALKILEVLAGAGNRIKILIYNVKDVEAEIEAAGGNWIAQRWLVEIFLVGMDETGAEIKYKTMGIGAANKKLLAKYAAAEDLYFNLKKTKYITEFPKYYIPIVHRLSVTVHEQVIQFLENSFPEGYDAALNYKIVVNDKDRDEPYYCVSFLVNSNTVSEVTHVNEDHAELLTLYRAYEALTGTRYEAENYLKGPKVNADLTKYRLVDTQAMTVATVPFEILSETTKRNYLERQAHRNAILMKKFTMQQEVDNRNMTEAEMDSILTDLTHCNLGGESKTEVKAEISVDVSGLEGDYEDEDEGGPLVIVEKAIDEDALDDDEDEGGPLEIVETVINEDDLEDDEDEGGPLEIVETVIDEDDLEDSDTEKTSFVRLGSEDEDSE